MAVHRINKVVIGCHWPVVFVEAGGIFQCLFIYVQPYVFVGIRELKSSERDSKILAAHAQKSSEFQYSIYNFFVVRIDHQVFNLTDVFIVQIIDSLTG